MKYLIEDTILKNTADALRDKKKTTEKIKPENFGDEINNLPSGGAINQEEYDTALNTTNNILNGATGYDWNGKQMSGYQMFSRYTRRNIRFNRFRYK